MDWSSRSIYRSRNRLGDQQVAAWLVAYKFEAEQAVTKPQHRIQVGKGAHSAANLEVKLAGTTVSRASLHNADEIARKDIRVGDHVVVEKAGEIIPYVIRSEPERRTGGEIIFKFPTTCPVSVPPVDTIEG